MGQPAPPILAQKLEPAQPKTGAKIGRIRGEYLFQERLPFVEAAPLQEGFRQKKSRDGLARVTAADSTFQTGNPGLRIVDDEI
jgi:hypothetical protein